VPTPSLMELQRAYYLSQLGLSSSSAPTPELQYLFYQQMLGSSGLGSGVAENRKFASGLYYNQDINGGNSTMTPVLNELDVFPFPVGKATTFDQIAIAVTTLQAATVMRLGLYASDSSGRPGALLVDAGTVAGDTTGAKTLAINQTLAPGVYWVAFCAQVTAIAGLLVRAIAAGWTKYVGMDLADRSVSGCGYLQAGVAGALPANFTFGPSNIFAGSNPRISLRAA